MISDESFECRTDSVHERRRTPVITDRLAAVIAAAPAAAVLCAPKEQR